MDALWNASQKALDAMLIAAAPELLAALQDLVFNTSMGADITKLIAVERAKAAIAKAIGQTGERG